MADTPLTPATPGKDIPFIKPNIPDCWSPQPTKEVASDA